MRLFVIFCMMAVLTACGGSDYTESPAPYQEDVEQEPDLTDLSIDLGYVTVVSGEMEGVFADTPVDSVTLIDGQSDPDYTRVDLIAEPMLEDFDTIVMSMNTIHGDVASENFETGGRGCSGERLFSWNYDRVPTYSTTEVTREGDLIIVTFEMDFVNEEWLRGSYVLALN